MRSFIQATLNAVAFVVSGCINVVGVFLMLGTLIGIYGGGIWLCAIGLDWAGHIVAHEPMIGYPIALSLMLALCAWVPAVGFIAALAGTVGVAAIVSSLADAVQRMVPRNRA